MISLFRGITIVAAAGLLLGCGGSRHSSAGADAGDTARSVESEDKSTEKWSFNADSAYRNVSRQVEFGPRIPGTASHKATADWLSSELKRYGWSVTEQHSTVKAFDGSQLPLRNIFAQINPEATDRTLLLAHYDTRPWADEDPDPAKRQQPIDGANDGGSGTGVLLEIARQLGMSAPTVGVDILLVDCEDYGTSGDEESWALGAGYFAAHPPIEGYQPARAILLDMVGGKDGVFPAEYYSRQAAADIDDAIRLAARRIGEGERFPGVYGGAVTDDHVKLIERGIPAVDIIEYRAEGGFNPTWHTTSDTLDNIDRETLGAVGRTVMEYLKSI